MNKFWTYYCSVLLAVILTTIVLYWARVVFMPLALAGMPALVFMRLCDWLERRGPALGNPGDDRRDPLPGHPEDHL